MALLSLSEKERIVEYDCIELLPDLVEDTLFIDILIPDIEESFVSGLDDWWEGFVADVFL
jgi:hypothetical protein